MFKITVKGVLEELQKVKDSLEVNRTNIVRNKVQAMTKELRDATPVDTGNARDSWNLVATGNKQQPYRVANSAPYIEYLNAGSSQQAPPFFVDKIALKYGKPVGAVVTIKENPEA